MKKSLYGIAILIVFCMALDYRFQAAGEGLPSITLVEALCYLAVLLFFADLALEGEVLSRRITAIYRKNRLVIWYFIWTGLASVASLVRSSDALRFYKDLFPSLVVYMLISVCAVNAKAVKGFVVAFLSGSVLILMVGLSQSLTGNPRIVDLSSGAAAFKTDFWGNPAGLNLSTGFFLHPNAYAIFLLPVTVLILGLLLSKGSGRPMVKVLLVMILLLTAYNLARTYSKGVIVWVAVGMGLLLVVMRMQRSRAIAAVVLLFASIAIITMYGIGPLGEVDQPYGTMITRLQLWEAGIALISSDIFVFFFGNGFTGMMTSSQSYSGFTYPNAHNTFINQVIYFGLPALFLYVGLAAQALRRTSELMYSRIGYQGIAAGVLFSTMTALLGIYFFEPANEGVILQMQFFAVLAFANSIGTELGARQTGKLESREE